MKLLNSNLFIISAIRIHIVPAHCGVDAASFSLCYTDERGYEYAAFDDEIIAVIRNRKKLEKPFYCEAAQWPLRLSAVSFGMVSNMLTLPLPVHNVNLSRHFNNERGSFAESANNAEGAFHMFDNLFGDR